MDQKRALIVIGAVILVLMAIVLGIAYYSGRAARRTVPTITPAPDSVTANQPGRSPLPGYSTPSPAPVLFATPTPIATPVGGAVSGATTDKELYNGQNFSFSYPASWGLLTCSNSSNVELDPNNNTDQLGYACDRAVKPVTMVIANGTASSCVGNTVTLGTNQVVKSVETRQSGATWYKWCVNISNGQHVEFTHRVSSTGGQATSTQDYSSSVEEIITTFKSS